MAQITLKGNFTNGTGALAWDIKGINNTYHANHTEGGSFTSPLTLPSGLYTLAIQGACGGTLVFNVTGDTNFSSPSLPETFEANGNSFNSGYTIMVKSSKP
jgi:hypothetical protein